MHLFFPYYIYAVSSCILSGVCPQHLYGTSHTPRQLHLRSSPHFIPAPRWHHYLLPWPSNAHQAHCICTWRLAPRRYYRTGRFLLCAGWQSYRLGGLTVLEQTICTSQRYHCQIHLLGTLYCKSVNNPSKLWLWRVFFCFNLFAFSIVQLCN